MRPPPLLALLRRCVQSGIALRWNPEGEGTMELRAGTGYIATDLLAELRAHRPTTVELFKSLDAEWQLPPGPPLTPDFQTRLALYTVERRHFDTSDRHVYECVLEIEGRRGTPPFLAMIWATEAGLGLNINTSWYRR